jgi:hypothetical protein
MKLGVAGIFLLAPTIALAAPAALKWESVFSARSAPKTIHFRASYADGAGRAHSLEVWRDGDRRLRRDTDGKMSVYVTKRAGGEYGYEVIDLESKVKVEISRTNLYRIGIFSDWAALATNLTRPAGEHAITGSKRGPLRTKAGECRWFRVEVRGAPAREVCWSTALALPLAIDREDGSGKATRELTIDEVTTSVAADVFGPPDGGLFHVDANRDIGPSDD